MSHAVTKLGRSGCEELNESAALAVARGCYLSRRPSSPTFWFYTLAIDANAHTFGPKLRALLSPDALTLIDGMNLAAFDPPVQTDENRPHNPWCTRCDRAFNIAGYGRSEISMWPGHYWSGVECWPCLFGEHDQCQVGCETGGEIHFPEHILDPSYAERVAA